MNTNNVIKALKVYAKEHGYSDEKMAVLIGVRAMTFYRWMTGRTKKMHGTTIQAIKRLIGEV